VQHAQHVDDNMSSSEEKTATESNHQEVGDCITHCIDNDNMIMNLPNYNNGGNADLHNGGNADLCNCGNDDLNNWGNNDLNDDFLDVITTLANYNNMDEESTPVADMSPTQTTAEPSVWRQPRTQPRTRMQPWSQLWMQSAHLANQSQHQHSH